MNKETYRCIHCGLESISTRKKGCTGMKTFSWFPEDTKDIMLATGVKI